MATIAYACWGSRACVAAILALASCADPAAPLTEGATWVSRTVPPDLVGKVTTYEQAQRFGEGNDPHGWRQIVRYTMRTDLPGPTAGCSFTGWIPGMWSVHDGALVIVTPSDDSGSLEMHACPDGSEPTTVPRAPHFVRATSPYRLEGRTLSLTRAFGEPGAVTMVLTRVN